MKKLTTAPLLLYTLFSMAQVGIGTDNPEAMLDVNGDLRVQAETTLEAPLKLNYIETEEITEFDGSEIILVADLSDEKIVKKVSLESLRNALGISTRNTTIYSASNDGGWSLLNLTLLGQRWTLVDFAADDKEIGDASLFSNARYTAPEAGIYSVSFELQLEGGVSVNVLGGQSLGILKNDELIKQKIFDAINAVLTIPLVVGSVDVPLAQVPVTSSELSTLVELNEDDTLSFGVLTQGLLPAQVGLLTDNKVSISIHKISDLLD